MHRNGQISIHIFPICIENRRLYPVLRRSVGSQQSAKFVDGKARITYDATHGQRVDRIMARDRENARAIGHDDVLALTGDAKADFLESSDGIQVVDARELGHWSSDFYFADVGIAKQFISYTEVVRDCGTNVRERLGFGDSLRPAPREPRDRYAVALIGTNQRDLVFHAGTSSSQYSRVWTISGLVPNGAMRQALPRCTQLSTEACLRQQFLMDQS